MRSGQEGVSEEVTLGRDSNDKEAAMERYRGGKSKVLEEGIQLATSPSAVVIPAEGSELSLFWFDPSSATCKM